ncbi:MAG: response regulator [Coriobacteriales bacterium]|jgi:signal transduction histidine kinase/CheY-like chemotaxis protein|nr:response regulator [Coriobacteriales bacterium]
MPIRLKAFLIILSIVVLVTVANTAMSVSFAQERLLKTVESDMSVVAQVADELVGSEIRVLRANARTLAHDLSDIDDVRLQEKLYEQADAYEDFSGLAVFDCKGSLLASYGMTALHDAGVDRGQLEWAFEGTPSLSTTHRYREGSPLLIYGYVPIAGQDAGIDRVLVVSIRGQFFSELLDDFTVWESGSIFILDNEGTMVANRQHETVERRDNYLGTTEAIPISAEGSALFRRMVEEGRVTGSYGQDGARQLCVSTPITESKVGWVLAVTAPLAESPAAQVQDALLLSALLFLALGAGAAVICSRIIARPYRQIEAQNVRLAELNEVAKDASEAKSRFLATMSHEMRTPLNAVVGLSELMLDTDDADEDAADDLARIHGAGVTLLRIVNDILDISKAESGRLELLPVEYGTPGLVSDVVALNSVRIEDKPVEFVLHIDEELPSRLLGDDLRVKQVCNNLLSNAFKYTKEGRVEWTLAAECDEEGGACLSIRVADTGIGIHAEDLEGLFSEYGQVDMHSHRAIEGTGLGLSITKRLVEAMDGSLSVESEYGVGSVFTARLHQELVDATPIGRETAQDLQNFRYVEERRRSNARLHRIPLPYASVLVVDDMQTNLDVTRGLMRPYGMRVDCVTSAEEAIERVRSADVRYDALFMDHMMPGMDGIEAARVIREEIGTDYARALPLIALTANALVGNEQSFLDRGFQAFLPKPVGIERLDGILRQWVRDEEKDTLLALADGIDMVRLLGQFGNDMAVALDVLGSFVANTAPLLARIGRAPEGGLADYAVIVHGIKGSCRGICAERAGAQAELLEQAARAGDLCLVAEGNGPFVALMHDLLAGIEKMVEGLASKAAKPHREAPDSHLLKRLAQHCDDFDMDGIDEVIAELGVYEYTKESELVVWLRRRIELMELDEVSSRLMPLAS